MFTYQDIILHANRAAPARCRPRLPLMCQTGSDVSADKDKEKRPESASWTPTVPLIYKSSRLIGGPQPGGGRRRRQLHCNARIGERGSLGPAHLLTFFQPSWSTR